MLRTLLCSLLLLWPITLVADATSLSRAMEAPVIALITVNDDGVTVELEISIDELPLFADLLPDDLYGKLNNGDTKPWAARLNDFGTNALRFDADGIMLVPTVQRFNAGHRAARNQVTGQIEGRSDLPAIEVVLHYPFADGAKPTALIISKQLDTAIGFLCHHRQTMVNELRYLLPRATLTLDWDDTWYSAFDAMTLTRSLRDAQQVYLNLDYYQLRQESILRLRELSPWIDIDPNDDGQLTSDEWPAVLAASETLLRQHNPVTIDGSPVSLNLAQLHFVERGPLRTLPILQPRDLDLDNAIIGVIFTHPLNGLPQDVTCAWQLYPAAAGHRPQPAAG
ncbi:MAG: hypothetical protein ACYTF0_05955 [Planctomycetota bacterium]|jgi:hypothetical protein